MLELVWHQFILAYMLQLLYAPSLVLSSIEVNVFVHFHTFTRIPVTFEGDLAHIAVSHLKKNDHVFIEGELSADYPAFGEKPGQTNIQVVADCVD